MMTPIPLTYVENCAEAIILAAEYRGDEERVTLNVVDDGPPTSMAYMKELRRHQSRPPRIIPLPWWAMRLAARAAWLVNRTVFGGTAKVPGLFVPSRLHARCKPLRYSNRRIRSLLKWAPRYSWREGVKRSIEVRDPPVDGSAQESHAERVEQIA